MNNRSAKLYGVFTGVLALGLLTVANFGSAGHHEGTSMEAKQMLQRAAAALEADQSAALAAFTAGTEGFKDRDLYVFCSGPDGKMTAHGANSALIGKNFCGFVDKAGKKFGQEMCSNASEEFKIVEYVWPRPGETEPSPKASYYTRVGDQICGVGFYE
jgi:signal transduction histidine kinase